MLSHLVKCPQFGCGWSGALSADRVDESWNAFDPIVVFQCPCCQEEWRARVIGNRVKPLPAHEDDLARATWPPLEIGVGD